MSRKRGASRSLLLLGFVALLTLTGCGGGGGGGGNLLTGTSDTPPAATTPAGVGPPGSAQNAGVASDILSIVSVSQSMLQIAALGAGQTATINMRVTDSAGNPRPGICVSFGLAGVGGGEALSAGISPVGGACLAQTDAGGNASTVLTPGNTPGIVTVTAFLDNDPNDGVQGGNEQKVDIPIEIVAGPPATIERVSTVPATIGIIGSGVSQSSAITFNVKDALGNPVRNGTCISFALNPGLGGVEALLPGAPAAGATCTGLTVNGNVTTVYRSGGAVGTATVTAFFDNFGGARDQVIQAVGVEVQANATVDVQGGAAAAVPGSIAVQLVETPPGTTVLAAGAGTNPGNDDQVDLTFRLRDTNNAAIAGACLSFTFQGTPLGGGETLSPGINPPGAVCNPAAVTNATGDAMTTFRAGSALGATQVTAFLDNNPQNGALDAAELRASVNLNVVAGPPAILEFVSASQPVVNPNGLGGVQSSTLTYRARDRVGNLVPNGTCISFLLTTAAGGGDSVSPAAAPCGGFTANGLATTTYQSGTTAGTATITAFSDTNPANNAVDAAEPQATASIQVQAQQPSSIQAISATNLPATAGSGTASVFTVRVRDQNNQPLQNACVSFELDGGGIGGGETLAPGVATSPCPAGNLTNAAGQVTTSYTPGTLKGATSLRAFIDNNPQNGILDAGELSTSTAIQVRANTAQQVSLLSVTRTTVELLNGADSSVLTFQVRDQFSNLVEDGQCVSFDTTFGTLSGTGSGTLTPGAAAGGTCLGRTVGGQVSTTYRAAQRLERVRVRAFADDNANGALDGQANATQDIQVTNQNSGTLQIITVSAPVVAPGGTSNITVEAKGPLGALVEQACISYIIEPPLIGGGEAVAPGIGIAGTAPTCTDGGGGTNHTAATGRDVVVFTAGSRPGVAKVTAFLDSNPQNGQLDAGEINATTNIQVVPGPPATLSVISLSSASVQTAGGANTTTLTVEARDAQGNLVADGTCISFDLSTALGGGESVTPGAPTGATPCAGATSAGRASTTYAAGTNTGNAVVRAFFDSDNPRDAFDAGDTVFVNVPVTVSNIPAASVSITSVTTSILAPGDPASTVTVTVRDAANNPLLNQCVSYLIQAPGLGGGEGMNPGLSPVGGACTSATNAMGQATSQFTAGTVPGNATIVAFLDNNPQNGALDAAELRATSPVQVIPGRPATITIVSLSASSVDTQGGNDTSVLTVEARDAAGNLVQDGTCISFSLTTPAGGGDAVNPGAPTGAQFCAGTTTNGRASTTYRSGTTAGNASITAFFDTQTPRNGLDAPDTARAVASVQVTNTSAASVSFTSVTTSITFPGGPAATLTATVRDPSNNPLAGQCVSFLIQAPGPGGGEGVTPGVSPVGGACTATTNAMGQATTQFFSGTRPGTATVVAFLDNNPQNGALDAGELSATTPIQVVPGLPATLTVVSLSASNVDTQGGNDTSVLTVEARDTAGNLVADGTCISFSLTAAAGGGDTVNPGAPTGAQFCAGTTTAGRASTTYRAGTTAGNATITAFFDTQTPRNGLDAPDTARVTASVQVNNTSAASIAISGITTSIVFPGGGNSTLTATVRDPSNNPLAGQCVSFLVQAPGLGGGEAVTPGVSPVGGACTAATNAMGQATTAFSPGTRTGTATVIAFLDNNPQNGALDPAELRATSQIQVVPGLPASLTVISLSASNVDVAGGNDTSVITVEARDVAGNLVADGSCISFSLTAAAGGGDSVNPGAPTGAALCAGTTTSGRATTTYRAGTTAGNATITAFFDTDSPRDGLDAGDTVRATASVQVNNTSASSIAFSSVSTSTLTPGATGAVLTATVRDPSNNPIAGQCVSFLVQAPGLGGGENVQPGISPVAGPCSATTNAMGQAATTFNPGTAPGTATVVAFLDNNPQNGALDAGELRATTAIQINPGLPASVAIVSLSRTTVDTQGGNDTSVITVEARDVAGNLVPNGTCISFALTTPAGGGDAVNPGAPTGAQFCAATTTNGRASTTYRAGTMAGNATITAFFDQTVPRNALDAGDTARATASVQVTATSAASIAISSVSTTTVFFGGAASTITATVRDPSNNPLANQCVSFLVQAPGLGGGEGVTPGVDATIGGCAAANQTNAMGQRATAFTAGTARGTATVVAFLDNNPENGALDAGELFATQQVTVAPGPPTAVTLVSISPSQVDVSTGTQTSSVLTFEARDASGGLVGDGTCLSFELTTAAGGGDAVTPGEPGFGPCAGTTTNGRAAVTYASGTMAGTATVTGYFDADKDTTVDAGEPRATGNVIVNNVGAASIAFTGVTTTTVFFGGPTSTLTATVRDAANAPLQNQCVSFMVNAPGLGGGEFVNPEVDTMVGGCNAGNQTNVSGQRATVFTAGTARGTATITAFLDNNPENGALDPGELRATQTVTVVAGPPAAISLVSVNPSQVDVNGGAAGTSALTFEARDAAGGLVADGTCLSFVISTALAGGESITNGAPVGAAPCSGTTVNGRATTSYISGTNAGTASVRAFYDRQSPRNGFDAGDTVQAIGSVIVNNITAGSIAFSSVSTTTVYFGGPTSTLTALVRDSGNNPLAGQCVSFLVQAPGLGGGENVNPEVDTLIGGCNAGNQTDAMGQRATVFTPGTARGPATVVAFLDSAPENGALDPGELSVTQVVNVVAGPPAAISLVSVSPNQIDANGGATGTSTLTFEARDAGGGLVADGTCLSFSITTALAGGESVNPGAPTGATPCAGTTTAGRASATYVSGTNTGNAVVTGFFDRQSPRNGIDAGDTVRATGTVQVNPTSAASITFSSVSTATVFFGGPTSTLTAEVRDAANNPLANQCVSFLVQAPGLGGGENVNPEVDTLIGGCNAGNQTNVSGQRATAFTAGTRAGTATVVAFLDNNPENGALDPAELRVTQQLNVVAGPPATITVVSVSSTSIDLTGGGNDAATILVEARDGAGNLVADGTCISFELTTAAGGGDTVNPGEPGTGACAGTTTAGRASTTYRSGSTAATATITAYFDGDRDTTVDAGEPRATASIQVTNTAAASIAITQATTSQVSFGAANATLTATVRDTNGNPLMGQCVSFLVQAPGLGGGESLNPGIDFNVGGCAGANTTNGTGVVTSDFIAGTANGTATVVAFLDNNPENGALDAAELRDTMAVNVVPGLPRTITLVSVNPGTVDVLNGPNDTSDLTFEARDLAGNLVSNGTCISFEVSSGGGTVSPGAPTGAAVCGGTTTNGRVTARFTAGAGTGQSVVSAVFDDEAPRDGIDAGDLVRDTGTVDVRGVSAASIAYTTIATAVFTPVASAGNLTVEVRDAANNIVVGDCVSYLVEAPGLGGGEFVTPGISPVGGPCSSSTNAMGQATFSFTPGSKTGTANVVAFLDDNPLNGVLDAGEISVSTPVQVIPGPPSVISLISANPGSVEVQGGNDTSTLRYLVTDVVGNLVSNGTCVSFAVTTGAGTVNPGAPAAAAPCPGVTTNGEVTTQFTAGNVVETNTIRAFIDDPRNGAFDGGETPVRTTLIPVVAVPPASIVVSSISTSFVRVLGSGAGETSTITFEVRDTNGVAVPAGTCVSFEFGTNRPNGGETLNPGIASIGACPAGNQTNASGQVTTTFQSGTELGTVDVVAFLDNNPLNGLRDAAEIQTAAQLRVVGGEPFTIGLVSVSPTTVTTPGVGGDQVAEATFSVKDFALNAVPDGTVIKFDTAGLLGGSPADILSPAQALTLNGQFSAFYRSGSTSGTASFVAYFDRDGDNMRDGSAAGEPEVTATVVVTDQSTVPDRPDSIRVISVVPPEVSVLGSGATQTSVITFEVVDVLGDPVNDVCVSFTLENGGLGGGEAVSPSTTQPASCVALTSNGQVQTTFRGGTIAGTINVIAFIDKPPFNETVEEDEIQATATLSVNGGPPAGRNTGLDVDQKSVFALIGEGPTLDAISGVTSNVTMYMADHFTNPVPDGTSVTFRLMDPNTLGPVAQVDGAGVTAGGNSLVTVEARSQVPIPSDGLVAAIGLTQSGAASFVRSLLRLDANTIYAGTDGGGVWKTVNGGTNWTNVGNPDDGLLDGFIWDIKENPTSPGEIFVATNQGVFRSLGGATWEARNGLTRIVNEPLAAPLAGSCDASITPVVAGATCTVLNFRPASESRLVVKEDGFRIFGYTVHKAIRNLEFFPGGTPTGNLTADYDRAERLPAGFPVTCLDFTPGGRLYAGLLGGGVWASDDGGISWEELSVALATKNIQDIAYDRDNDDLYVATRGSGVLRNTDPTNVNQAWAAFNTGLLDGDVTRIEIDDVAGAPTNIVIGTRGAGVQINNAGTWQVLAGTPADPFRTATPPDVEVTDLVISSASPDKFYATTIDVEDPNVSIGRVWECTVSTNDCTAAAGTGLPSRFLYAVDAFDVTGGSQDLVIGSRGRSVSFSTDDAATFTEMTGTAPDRISNGIFATTQFTYTGETDIHIEEDPNLENDFGCGTGSPVASGDCRIVRVLIRDRVYDRPIAGGSQVNVTGTGVASGGSNTQTYPARGFVDGGEDITDFIVVFSNGNPGPNPAACGISASTVSPNGNVTQTLGYLCDP